MRQHLIDARAAAAAQAALADRRNPIFPSCIVFSPLSYVLLSSAPGSDSRECAGCGRRGSGWRSASWTGGGRTPRSGFAPKRFCLNQGGLLLLRFRYLHAEHAMNVLCHQQWHCLARFVEKGGSKGVCPAGGGGEGTGGCCAGAGREAAHVRGARGAAALRAGRPCQGGAAGACTARRRGDGCRRGQAQVLLFGILSTSHTAAGPGRRLQMAASRRNSLAASGAPRPELRRRVC